MAKTTKIIITSYFLLLATRLLYGVPSIMNCENFVEFLDNAVEKDHDCFFCALDLIERLNRDRNSRGLAEYLIRSMTTDQFEEAFTWKNTFSDQNIYRGDPPVIIYPRKLERRKVIDEITLKFFTDRGYETGIAGNQKIHRITFSKTEASNVTLRSAMKDILSGFRKKTSDIQSKTGLFHLSYFRVGSAHSIAAVVFRGKDGLRYATYFNLQEKLDLDMVVESALIEKVEAYRYTKSDVRLISEENGETTIGISTKSAIDQQSQTQTFKVKTCSLMPLDTKESYLFSCLAGLCRGICG